jgi:hypothetical protein
LPDTKRGSATHSYPMLIEDIRARSKLTLE